MSKKRIWNNRIFAIAGAVIAVVLIAVFTRYAFAAEDGELALTPPSVHVKDAQIEKSTLAIGSHLIYVGSMTDELYEIAVKSASTFSQDGVYYKSELSGGTWYEISSATSIVDISTGGTPVPASTIENLEFTHHTKSDGRTYDLVEGTKVNIFDINDPYDMDVMEELRPLVAQYMILTKKDNKSDSDEENIDLIAIFFSEELKTEETDTYDKGLASLQAYYNSLSPTSDEEDQRDITSMVMGKVDASRRIIVLTKLYDLLGELSNKVMNQEIVNADLSESIIESQDNIQSSLLECSVKALADGTTVIGKEEYTLISELIENSKIGSTKCAPYISKLADLYNIRDNVVDKRDKEYSYLNSILVPAGEKAYKYKLASGESDKYKEMKQSGASQKALDQCKEEAKSELNAVRSEYQFLLDARVLRMSNEEALALLTGELNKADSIRKGIKSDAFSDIANESVDQYKQGLKETLAEVAKSGSSGSAMSDLQSQKDKLLEQQKEAIDDNNFSDYNRLQALIDAKDKEINELEKKLTDVITSNTASDADKTIAAAQLGSGTAANTAISIAENVVNDIQSGNVSNLGSALDALDALMDSNSKVVTASLEDIKDALESATSIDTSGNGGSSIADGSGSVDLDDLEKRLNSMIDEGRDKSNQNGLSTSDIDKFIEDMFGSPFLGLSENEQVAIAVAVEWYGEMNHSSKIKELAASYADVMLNGNSKYVYPKLNSSSTYEYVSTKALAECIGYRYVFDESRTEVTLQQRRTYFTFRAGETEVIADGGRDKLSQKAEYQNYVYIPADYVFDMFEYQTEYMSDSPIAILYNDEIGDEAQNIYNLLTQKGGN